MDALRASLTHPAFVAGSVYLACVLYVHRRGKVRLRLERQLTEHSGIFAPVNTLLYLFSAVPKDPFLPPRDFPQLAPLRENWETIRDEALALRDAGRITYDEGQQDLTFLSFRKQGWKRFHMKWYGDFLPSALRRCPETTALLAKIPDVNSAAFTMLPPGGLLGKHRDPFAVSLRYHLGLACPGDGCRIWVDGTEHTWRDGEDVVFDETYVHWAENTTDRPRLILFGDFTRPLHTRAARWLNQFLIDHFWGITASHNEPDERPGMLNRITPVFHALKRFFRRLKLSTPRKLYYGVKYALFALALWALFVRARHGL